MFRFSTGEEPETDSPNARSPTGPRPSEIADGEESHNTLVRGTTQGLASQGLLQGLSSQGLLQGLSSSPQPSTGCGLISQGSWGILDEPAQDAAPSTGHSRSSPLPTRAESPIPVDPSILDTDLEIGSMVEVLSNPPKYGVIRWIGYCPWVKPDPSKPIAGLEMVNTFINTGKCRF